jgi:hypothetical protein
MLCPTDLPKTNISLPIGNVWLVYKTGNRLITLPQVYVAVMFIEPLTQLLHEIHHKAGVTHLVTSGVYNLRKQRSNSKRWSQHAYGTAIDIVGLVSKTKGFDIQVTKDWTSPRWQALWRLLERVCERASKGYRYTYLTPANSPLLHNDHIHWGIWPPGA